MMKKIKMRGNFQRKNRNKAKRPAPRARIMKMARGLMGISKERSSHKRKNLDKRKLRLNPQLNLQLKPLQKRRRLPMKVKVKKTLLKRTIQIMKIHLVLTNRKLYNPFQKQFILKILQPTHSSYSEKISKVDLKRVQSFGGLMEKQYCKNLKHLMRAIKSNIETLLFTLVGLPWTKSFMPPSKLM
ncbi:unnamed protein product [Ceutorhynchus assimilis]|uniref:Uncharacterized protein n=1 Tax=Ceutorhynchus assimilis TaxID=467358 RepID=A0A9N9MNG2_9CUCU|nr:unnamed protein product [Ceutorhynchus assimilis]